MAPQCAGAHRGPRPRAHAQDQGKYGPTDREMPRSAVLYSRPSDHRHRSRLRPHHFSHRRGTDRMARHGYDMLCDPEGAPGPAESGRCAQRRDHIQDRRTRGRHSQRPSGRTSAR